MIYNIRLLKNGSLPSLLHRLEMAGKKLIYSVQNRSISGIFPLRIDPYVSRIPGKNFNLVTMPW